MEQDTYIWDTDLVGVDSDLAALRADTASFATQSPPANWNGYKNNLSAWVGLAANSSVSLTSVASPLGVADASMADRGGDGPDGLPPLGEGWVPVTVNTTAWIEHTEAPGYWLGDIKTEDFDEPFAWMRWHKGGPQLPLHVPLTIVGWAQKGGTLLTILPQRVVVGEGKQPHTAIKHGGLRMMW